MAIKSVKCIRSGVRKLTVDAIYRVLVDVTNGIDYKGRECSGYILDNSSFPYVWDRDRFVDYVETEETAGDGQFPSIPTDDTSVLPETASDTDIETAETASGS